MRDRSETIYAENESDYKEVIKIFINSDDDLKRLSKKKQTS